MFQFAK